MNQTRRLYLNNWAILTEENETRWHFGELSQEKLDQTVDFVNALSKLGTQLFGEQGIGVIRLRYRKPHPTKAREILVVNLLNKYGIMISDPLVTTRMFDKIELDEAPLDEMRSILAGAASVIYSEFYSQEKNQYLDRKTVDNIFQEAVNSVTYNEDVTVGNGQCSFSALTLEELLFFHALLRDLFESHVTVTVPSPPWGIIHAKAGAPLYLDHNPPLDAALISAFSSVIVSYCRILFDAYPARLVFGAESMAGMDFIATDTNIFVINNPRRLLRLQKFVRKWKQLPAEIQQDLVPAMSSYFIELALQEEREKMKDLEFHRIINRLTRMGIHRAREYQFIREG